MATASQSLPYTASPYRLALADLLLWARITFVLPPSKGIPSIVFPILPFRSGALDELYPTPANLWSLVLQLAFTTLQVLFVISIPISATLGIGFPLLPPLLGAYVPIWLAWILAFVLVNRFLSILLLDGVRGEFHSQISLSTTDVAAHADEKWVFVNGVAAGSHWMQSNLDRLSLTFRREITGIHNQTRGILFDLIECILERTFSYATPSTRMVYQHLLDIISNSKYKKIILILHSQGAIEGGLALDWLFATLPGSQLSRVEVYTFGSAANHFNDPTTSTMDSNGKRVDIHGSDSDQAGRIIQHIEHYANSGDYVAKFGILNFRPLPAAMMQGRRGRGMYLYDPITDQEVENRYVGRLFIRQGTGHQLNGNYLDDFFPMNQQLTKVLDQNVYMNSMLDQRFLEENDIVVAREQDRAKSAGASSKSSRFEDKDDGDNGDEAVQAKSSLVSEEAAPRRIKDASRLWMYRNGMSPPEE